MTLKSGTRVQTKFLGRATVVTVMGTKVVVRLDRLPIQVTQAIESLRLIDEIGQPVRQDAMPKPPEPPQSDRSPVPVSAPPGAVSQTPDAPPPP